MNTDTQPTDELESAALEKLSDGLELIIDRDGARWQVPGRTALYFEVDRERAEAIFTLFSDRFCTRDQNGSSGWRRVLTPEPLPADEEPDEDAGDPEPETAVLTRRWHTSRELAEQVGVHHSTMQTMLRKHRESLTVRLAPIGRGGPAYVYCVQPSLAHALEDAFGVEVIADLDAECEPRTTYPETIELDEPRYSYDALANLGNRTTQSTGQMVRSYGVPRKKVPVESGGMQTVVPTTPALAVAIEACWNAEVTITAETPDRREVGA
jgi:hypothetical protein